MDAAQHRSGDRRRTRPVVLAAVKVLGAMLSILLFCAFGYGWYSYHTLTAVTKHVDVGGLAAPTTAPNPQHHHVNGPTQNILVVGVDSRAGLSDDEKRTLHVGTQDATTSTDTIMLIHIPGDGRSATLVSIPRDTYVDIPGHPSNKINAAYADGYYNSGAQGQKAQQKAAMTLLVNTVHNLTGVPINHYVQVGFAGFVDIVKAIGTVPVNLCESVDDTHLYNAEHGISGGSGFEMAAGHHDLTPVQALEFVRQRHNIPGPISDDFGRELRQRYFLSAAFSRVLTAHTLLNPVALNRLIHAVGNAFTFDNNGLDLQSFAEQLVDLSAGKISGQSIHTTGSHLYPAPTGSALTVDPAQVRHQVRQLFGLDPIPPAAPKTPGAPRPTHHAPAKPRGCVY